ncbi:ATP-binding protein [Halalkalirubrum salinum]|uniref:ATP-binding protein n=1 Tax=Halalkalirubrum salinum TaxID=2563889 RepID=UPI0010FB961D|nr:PAS domain-containing sensor histidine kinase [Halalkalirubrum salinum]
MPIVPENQTAHDIFAGPWSELNVTTLLETLPIGVVVLDADGSIVDANPRAETVLGLTHSEITTRVYDDPTWKIVDADGDPIAATGLPFARVTATGEAIFECEHGIQWPDGSERWLSINAAPFRSENIDGVVAIITDLTDRQAHAEAIERQNEQLAAFASIVSHDLRNPLSVASGHLELLRAESQSERIDPISRALERMDALISDLLSLARSGAAIGELEAVDLTTLVTTCWSVVSTVDATLEIQTTRSVHADRTRLEQLVENLFRNAIEHGGNDVSVIVEELPDGFAISDDGPGIPEQQRETLFDLRDSIDEDDVRFGLRIVKQIADAHRWDVSVTNSDRGGARFELTGVTFGATQ